MTEYTALYLRCCLSMESLCIRRFNVNHIYLNLRFNMNHKVIAVDVTVEKESAAKIDPHFVHIIESGYDISAHVIAECFCQMF